MIWVYAGAAVAAVAIGFGGGWQVRSWKAGNDQAAALELAARDAARQAERTDTAAVTYETKRAAGQTRTRVITKEVDRVVEVYRDRPCLDAAGLQLVQAAISADPAASSTAPAVPASAPAR